MMTMANRAPWRARAIAALLLVACLGAPISATAQDDLWAALRSGGHSILLRHAIAPGTGDPANFAIGDCTTQRNLSAEGRAQARAIGERLRDKGISGAQVVVRSSQWCRCLETARLLGLGAVEEFAALNSFFGDRSRGPAQTDEVRNWLARRAGAAVAVLVTHQVNITALTGVYPRSGEMVVVRTTTDGEVQTVGTIPPE